MADAARIELGYDYWVPGFEVLIDGRKISREVVRDVLSVTYTDHLRRLDSFSMVVNNWDEERLQFKYSDEQVFDPGQKVEIWLGYRSGLGLRRMLRGRITSLRPSFPANGSSTLAISGQNLLHELRKGQRSHRYEGKRESRIAREVADRLGVPIDTDPTAELAEVPLDDVVQENEEDLVFLSRRATRLGYEILVEENDDGSPRLAFRPSEHVKPAEYRLGYIGSKKGRLLIEFQPTIATARQVERVCVRGWSATKKSKIEACVDRSSLGGKYEGALRGSVDKEVKGRTLTITDVPVQDQAEAAQVARRRLTAAAKETVKARARAIGLPDLRAGSVVHIDGVGKRFSGRYFVTSTTHTLGGNGYTTSFECRMEAT